MVVVAVAPPLCFSRLNRHLIGASSNGFTLNSVPPSEHEIVPGAVGRNFISRDLLEAQSIDDALERIYIAEVSVGHSYNLVDFNTRRILNVETASRNRHSVQQITSEPFFHAKMYLHLKVHQVPLNAVTSITDGFKKLYIQKLKPLEATYHFNDFVSPLFTNNDFDAKPMVMLLGQYSTGKTTFIKHLLGNTYPGAHIGPEPTNRFVVVMNGPSGRSIPPLQYKLICRTVS